ncbi:hypothetical protein ABVT39_007040 [Epinephelus coioides]
MLKYLVNDFDEELFRIAGEIFATSIAQGGPAPRFLQPWCYDFLASGKLSSDHVLDPSLSPLITTVAEVSDMADYISDILDCSYTGKIDMEHKENILRSVGLHVMTKRMPMLQQLREGLDIYGFSQVMQAKTEECRSLFVAGDDKSINTGIMCLQNDTMKAVRGKTLPLIVDPDTDAAGLHLLAVKKMTDFNTDLEEGPYVLIYPDSTEVNNIPGTLKPFTLRGYKAEIGKPYNRITVFICLRTDYDKKAVPKSFKEGTDNVRRHAAEHLKHATAKRTGGNINSSSLEPLHQGVLHLPV